MEIIFEAFFSWWRQICHSSLLMTKGVAYATGILSDRKAEEEKRDNTASFATQKLFSFAQ